MLTYVTADIDHPIECGLLHRLLSCDEAAVAWERVRELGETTDALRVDLKSAKTALHHVEKALNQERTRFSWIENDNDRLRADLDATRKERDELHVRLRDVNRPATAPTPTTRPQAARRPNRAQRRRADRERRRI